MIGMIPIVDVDDDDVVVVALSRLHCLLLHFSHPSDHLLLRHHHHSDYPSSFPFSYHQDHQNFGHH